MSSSLYFRSALLFTLISGGGWLTDFGLLFALVRWGIAPGISNFISASTAAMAVYFISRRIAFGRTEIAQAKWGAIYYAIYTGFIIIFFSVAIQFLVPVVGNLINGLHPSMTDEIDVLLTKVIVTPINLALNFTIARFLAKFY